MRNLGFLVLLLSLFLALGCCLPNETFVEGVDALANESGLLDEYDKYIDADDSIGDTTKEIRKGTSKKLRELIEDAKKNQEE